MSLAEAFIDLAIEPATKVTSDGSATVALYAMIGVLGSALILGIVQIVTSRSAHTKPASGNTAAAKKERHYSALILFLASHGDDLHVDPRKVKTGYESLEEVRLD